MWGRKTVAVIISDINSGSIKKVIEGFDSTGYVDEIVVVGDKENFKNVSSTLRTRGRYLVQTELGLSYGIKEAINSTKSDLVIVTDAYGSFEGADILKLLSYSSDFEMVFGTRTHVPLIHKGSGMTFTRRIVDVIFGKIVSLVFFSPTLSDVACILRLSSRKSWKKIQAECTYENELFYTEWLLYAVRKKIPLVEIPVNFVSTRKQFSKKPLGYYSLRALQILYLILKIRFF